MRVVIRSGCAILPAGKVTLVPEMTLTMPLMPKTRSASSTGSAEGGTAEEVVGFWRVGDKYEFDNLGVSKAAGDVSGEGGGEQTLRFLMCADCDLGPFGWFADASDRGDKLGEGVDFFVATERVRYAT